MNTKITSILCYGILGGAASLSFLLPDELSPPTAYCEAPPATISILGVVRDFRMDHPDFDLSPTGSDVAGSVRKKLDEHGRPAAESTISSYGSDGPSTLIDLISGWSFDEGSGVTAADRMGIQDGVLLNLPDWVGSGQLGSALRFDGIDDCVQVAHDPAYLVDAASFALWFKAEDTTSRQVLLGKGADGFGDGGHVTCFIENDRVQVDLRSTTASYLVESAPGSITVDTWHHVAFSFGPDGMLLFLDNEPADSDPYAGGLGTSSGGSGNVEPWTIGADYSKSGGDALDQFSTVSYGGSDGSRPWAGPWVESYDDGSAATGTVSVQSNLLHVDNSDSGTGPTMTRGVDLLGATTATLTFDFGGYGTGPLDIFAVEASEDGGVTYVELESITVIEHVTDSRSFELHDFIGLTANVVVRFRLVQGFRASGQHFTLDNVRIEDSIHWSAPFGGLIDEVLIFARPLTGTDFSAVGGFAVGAPRRDSSGRPVAPHLDEDGAPCFAAGDTPATVGITSGASIASPTTFSKWFHDAPGTNLATAHPITLTMDGTGVYEYLTDDFHPIDGKLFGNEGETHNQFYTYSFSATFTYHECTGQFFEFEGGHGAWMFIDDDLTLDLGGVGSSTPQYAELDRLGLVDGQVYTLRFFYAQRWSGDATFNLRTNILLNGASQVVSSGVYD